MQYIFDNQVEVSLRDGVTASAVVWRPSTGAAPTLLVRSPYGTHEPAGPLSGGGADFTPYVLNLLDAGYAVVWVECRGTYRSEGTFAPVVDEMSDAEDAMNWIVAQPWSDGSIGTYGFSYVGMTQWAASATAHPALKAVAPSATTMNWHSGCWYSPGGLLSHSLVASWHAFMYLAEELRKSGADVDEALVGDLLSGLANDGELIRRATISGEPLLARRWLPEYLDHPDYDDFWHAHDFTRHVERMMAPALVVSGWFDLFINTQVKDWLRLRQRGGSSDARTGSRLVIGPWGHEYQIGQYPDANFGPLGSIIMGGITEEHVAFFDEHVKGVPAAIERPTVRIFVMGRNEWLEADDFPLPGTRETEFYLGSDSLGDAVPEAWSKSYDFDPNDPVPTAGGALLPTTYGLVGPVDQEGIAHRDDVLSFTSTELTADYDVIGFVRAVLFVSSSARDTDFTAKLIDVHPDGRALSVCDGALRMRYRAGLDHAEAVEPGQVYEIEVDMAVTAMTFHAGHRIRLDISSSNFPRFDVNSNTGGVLAEESPDDWTVARNSVYGGGAHASRLILPLYGHS